MTLNLTQVSEIALHTYAYANIAIIVLNVGFMVFKTIIGTNAVIADANLGPSMV